VQSNRLRSIKELTTITAFFDPSEESERRFSLHMNVSFAEERFGGGKDSNVTFKAALRNCQIVVVLPSTDGKIVPDPKTVRTSPPKTGWTITNDFHRRRTKSARGKLGIDKTGVTPEAIFEHGGATSSDETASLTETKQPFDELYGSSHDGHPSWRVSGGNEPNGRIIGSLWDLLKDPRFDLLDKRAEAAIAKAKDQNMPPNILIQVRCRREDIDIYDISHKDMQKNEQLQAASGHINRMRSAEAYLRNEFIKEGLTYGEMDDPYAEMHVCELSLTLDDCHDDE